MRCFFAGVISFFAFAHSAQAEWFEHVAEAEGMLVIPQLDSSDATRFAPWSVGARVGYGFGVLHDVYVVGRFASWMHQGQLRGVTETGTTGTFTGTLAFHGEGYRPELGVRYKLLSGYNLAPYAEAYVGYQWTTFRGRDLRNSDGGSFGLKIADIGRAGMTLAGGVSLDYRLFNRALVGASATYTRVWDEEYRGDVAFSLRFGFSFF